MVIYLENDLIDNGVRQEGFYPFLRNIMLAYAEGKHIIIISPKNVKKLLSDDQVDQVTKINLNSYYSHNMSALSMLSAFQFVICITTTEHKEEKKYDRALGVMFKRINFTRFLDSSNIQKTILLGENGNDSDVYALFAEYYKKSKKMDSFRVIYKRQSGGGSAIVKEYEEIFTKEDEFCLCIVDSDKRNPKKKYGDTASKVFRYHNSKQNHNLKCDYLILPVLEVENLFPEGFYLNKYTIKYPIETFPLLRRIERNAPFARRYFDFKKGIAQFSEQKDEGTLEYWYHLIQHSCIKCKLENGSEFRYIKGFGENVLNDFLEHDREDIFRYIQRDSVLNKIWLKIGAIVCSSLLAPNINRAS